MQELHDGLPNLLLHHGEDVTDLTGGDGAGARVGFLLHDRFQLRTTAAASAPRPRSRYRQWLTHKLASWIDQFGTSGCVGCGRCITWCPVAIDITEEVAAIRATDGAARKPPTEIGEET